MRARLLVFAVLCVSGRASATSPREEQQAPVDVTGRSADANPSADGKIVGLQPLRPVRMPGKVTAKGAKGEATRSDLALPLVVDVVELGPRLGARAIAGREFLADHVLVRSLLVGTHGIGNGRIDSYLVLVPLSVCASALMVWSRAPAAGHGVVALSAEDRKRHLGSGRGRAFDCATSADKPIEVSSMTALAQQYATNPEALRLPKP